MTIPTPEPTAIAAPVPTPIQPLPAQPEARFTQADLDRMLQKERETAQRKALGDFLTQTGFESTEAAATALKAAETARQAALTEQQRAAEAAQTAQKAAEAAQATANQRALEATLRFELVNAGVPPLGPDGKANPKLAAAARLADVKPGADEATVTAAIEAVKAIEPAWFIPVQQQTVPSVNPGTPPSAPTGGNSISDMRAAALRWHEQNGRKA